MNKLSRTDAIGGVLLWVAILAVFSGAPARAETRGEFLIFVNIDGENRRFLGPDHTSFNNLLPGADLFATLDAARFRLLAEYFLNEDESELERLQVGMSLGEATIWFGRFHNPIGYWNTQFHHGTGLQTTIDRPGITDFEDDGGPLSSHISGVLIEGTRTFGTRGMSYNFALGAGPEFADALEPLNLLDPNAHQHKLASTIRLSYFPDAVGRNEFGVFGNVTQIPSANPEIEEIDQRVLGLFASFHYKRWHFIAELYDVNNRLHSAAAVSQGSFANGFLETQYEWNNSWTLYARAEASGGVDDDPYLALIPDFVQARYLGGIQRSFPNRHALRLEAAHTRTMGESFRKISMRWSVVLP